MQGRKPSRWIFEGKQYDAQQAAAILGKLLGLQKAGGRSRRARST